VGVEGRGLGFIYAGKEEYLVATWDPDLPHELLAVGGVWLLPDLQALQVPPFSVEPPKLLGAEVVNKDDQPNFPHGLVMYWPGDDDAGFLALNDPRNPRQIKGFGATGDSFYRSDIVVSHDFRRALVGRPDTSPEMAAAFLWPPVSAVEVWDLDRGQRLSSLPNLRLQVRQIRRTLGDEGFHVALELLGHWVFDTNGNLIRKFETNQLDQNYDFVEFSRACSRITFWGDDRDTVRHRKSSLPYGLNLRPGCW
jgi:hypothetical protein